MPDRIQHPGDGTLSALLPVTGLMRLPCYTIHCATRFSVCVILTCVAISEAARVAASGTSLFAPDVGDIVTTFRRGTVLWQTP